jgi:gamma-glutamylcyclotransferase (GGCT)/AIG2-like uncharacterized protein YtfP
MPLYFAYGANMSKTAMAGRCPKSRPLGLARLVRHRSFIMSSGYLSVRRDPGMDVHGVLFDLALSDVAALDRYEDIGRGLYTKVVQPVLRKDAAAARALVYIGRDQNAGVAHPDYMAGVLAAAHDWELPPRYIAHLATFSGAKEARARIPTPAR